MYNEIDYSELFGVSEGAEGQEVTDPADDQGEQGEEGQEVAVPADEAEGEVLSDSDTDETIGEEADGEFNAADADSISEGATVGIKPKQSPEENARYAAARRKAEAERDVAIAKAKEEARAEARAEAEKFINEAFATAGLTNPYTGKPITSKEELATYRAEHDKARRAEFLRKSGVSEDELNAFVNELPEVKAAKAATANAAAAKKAADEAAAKAKLEGELREISTLTPEIKSLSDLTNHESYQRVYDLVKKGNSLIDAFKLANYDTLTKGAAAVAKRAAVSSARSKDHMTATQTRGAGAVSVPHEIMEEYRALMPDITDAEIRAHYARNHK